MGLIADAFLVAGAIGAAIYCFVLGRRLNRFNDLEKGVGGAVAVLSAQVDDLTKTVAAAQSTAARSAETLSLLTKKAEDTSRRIELQMASLHDLPPLSTSDPEPMVEKAKEQEIVKPSPEGSPPAPVKTQPSQPMFVRHQKIKESS